MVEKEKVITLPIIVKEDDNSTLMAYSPVFRWCHTFAENKKDLSSNLEEVIWLLSTKKSQLFISWDFFKF